MRWLATTTKSCHNHDEWEMREGFTPPPQHIFVISTLFKFRMNSVWAKTAKRDSKSEHIYLSCVESVPSVRQKENLHVLRKRNELNVSEEESEYLKLCFLHQPFLEMCFASLSMLIRDGKQTGADANRTMMKPTKPGFVHDDCVHVFACTQTDAVLQKHPIHDKWMTNLVFSRPKPQTHLPPHIHTHSD